MLEVTLSHIKAANTACDTGMSDGVKLVQELGVKDAQPVPILIILDRLGVVNALYCLGVVKQSSKDRAEKILEAFTNRCLSILNSAKFGSSTGLRRKQYVERCAAKTYHPAQKAIDISAATQQALSYGHQDAAEIYLTEGDRQRTHLEELLNGP